MKNINLFSQISLLERYLIKELIPPLLFAIFAFSTVAELIGISFEQVRFIVNRGLDISTSIYIHILKLPAFIVLALPMAILLATMLTYSRLSRKSEIIAFQSCGLSLYNLIMPSLGISILVAFMLFILNELIVPPANYKAAIILEKSMNVDRLLDNSNDIIYGEFNHDSQNSRVQSIFYAEKFTGSQMQGITVLIFNQQGLHQIIESQSAKWDEKQKVWLFHHGVVSVINSDGSYGDFTKFAELSLNIPRTPLELATHNRDNREMNLFQAWKQLAIIKQLGDIKTIRKLQISIQEKFAIPFSCAVLALVGSSVGINSQPRVNNNGFGIALIIIFSYYMMRLITTTCSLAGVIPVSWGVWLPNIIGTCSGCLILARKG
ncbi:MAG: LptF/LptG family permease [Nostocaceae cyanobacterium]|nr:LptF/LptG family permease [Nostocaceae cyanobacterium]